MNDKGEMTCPLCAEEMDLTDQHLKPCKCGYQICVWCWHHIIEMAEKDKTLGRCPACRNPYDKKKISCEGLAAELNNDRKKPQKVKPKHSEAKKDLHGVRVIQRNLVYVMSLPLDLADEDLFQRREYFGQYGKVVKVALSRTAAGAVQQFPNDSCSVYITYSKEEEAIRCIQSVHGFIFDGKTLKACFGTMKYCHAWLRNMPCTNSECLYLHEFGSQEDSFPKDETISVHMKKIIQQITAEVNNYPRRTGSMLPPPVDDYVENESTISKIPKYVLNNAHSVVKSPLPNGSNGRPFTLPAGALWGMHASSQSSLATNSAQVSAPHSDVIKKTALDNSHTTYGNALKPTALLDNQTDFPELSVSNKTQNSNSKALVSASVDNTAAVNVPSDCTELQETMLSNGNKESNGTIQSVYSNALSVDADSMVDGYGGMIRSESLQCDHASIKPSHTEVTRDSLQYCVTVQPLQGRTTTNEAVVSKEANAGMSLIPSLVTDQYIEAEDDISLFYRQRLEDPEVQPNLANKTGLLHVANCMQPCSSQYKDVHDESRPVFGSYSSVSRVSNIAPVSHGCIEMPFSDPSRLNGSSLNHPILFPDKARDTLPVGNCSVDSQGNYGSEIDDRIIANILALGLDEYLTLPQNLSKVSGVDDVEARSHKPVSSNEVKNSQSRFSFARQEESNDQGFESCNAFNQISTSNGLYQNSSQIQSPNIDMLGMYNGFSSNNLKGIDYVTGNFLPSSYKPPSVPRSPVSAPPGFSVPNLPPPPPGFASNGREQQIYNGFSGNNRISDSTMYGNTYQSLQHESIGGVKDVQFMDPAILAVGPGYENPSLDFRSNFFGNDAKLQQQQLVMQSLLSPHQNYRCEDSLGMQSRLMDQSQGSNIPSRNMALSNNSQWDGLSNEIQSLNRLQNDQMNGYNGTFRFTPCDRISELGL
ncbi:unnamed protein product [Cochlearia groenlandica]